MSHPDSPYTPEISDEWSYLITDGRDKLTVEEQQSRWRRLMDRAWDDNGWKAGYYDATLIATLGISLALQTQDFVLAREIAERMLAHSEFDEVDDLVDAAHFLTRCGVATLLSGDISEGLAILRRPFLDRIPSDSRYAVCFRYGFMSFFGFIPAGQTPDPRIVVFVSELIGCLPRRYFPGREAMSRKALRVKSYGELQRVLSSAHSRRLSKPRPLPPD